MATSSCLYRCTVMHQRLVPKRHRFAYTLFWFCLDLAELTSLPQQVKGFAAGLRWAGWPGYGFYANDHLPDGTPETLTERLASVLAGHNVDLPPDANIRLVTLCRFLGYGFNPVCFWFVAQPDGTPLAIVAEVQNTFREVKPYVLTQPGADGWWQLTVPKQFYVSPFLATDDWFMFRIRWLPNKPGARLQIGIHTVGAATTEHAALAGVKLVSTFVGQRVPLTTGWLWWLTLLHPWVPLWVMGAIHWHALLLWFKRIPFFAHTPVKGGRG
jgi:uncharacterized protein